MIGRAGGCARRRARSLALALGVTAVAGASWTAPEMSRATEQVPEQATHAPVRAAANAKLLNLRRVPWEGGSAYWKQYARPKEAGWSNASFFPIAVWWGGLSNQKEADWDKAHGINTYVLLHPDTQYRVLENNDLYYVGSDISGLKQDSRNWVGDFLEDEIDGWMSPAEGFAYLDSLATLYEGDGRFKYANFTQTVLGTDLDTGHAEKYVNDYTDAVSVDMYWYTIPFCDWRPYRAPYLTTIRQSNCRTASSYGRMMNSLSKRDAADGKRQMKWQFVEMLSGSPGEGPAMQIAPRQVKGAVMNSVINEARGIIYFNQSVAQDAPCGSGNVVRDAQTVSNFCGAAQVRAAGRVNRQIQRLARVINTQSYRYRFGAGLDTMLKARGKYAYIFSMINGASQPGVRRFRLPAGVQGRKATVLFEKRSIKIGMRGRFRDTFAHEADYHIYRVPLKAPKS
ncbi:hypothetical protein E8D34_20360 [Nocardioides sp. GY 10113]|uniref:hypothetical protein n=1 Tax=Nocardioides sp. GY 10113 TaxID=2569761 RepID=UPI0010A76DF9|nr:hypothetical protein [Nocardioides sp. GY 10113]TIC79529.1 hypothetical protein E8D34_20360 [Nocardioides sp. GY 10113]